jgi:rhodanese-related sulfurtransferase
MSQALDVNIIKGLPYVDVDVNGENIRIQRIQDTNHKLKNSYTKTSRPTPPFNIQPFEPIKGIRTVSELDVIDFIKDNLSENEGLLIDARMPKWYQNGTIPGSLNVPFSILAGGKENLYIEQVFEIFGVEKEDTKLDFSDAQTLLVFDNGPWCQQGVAAMKHLIRLGYPKDKILYYRGGLQFWQIVGLTITKPKD